MISPIRAGWDVSTDSMGIGILRSMEHIGARHIGVDTMDGMILGMTHGMDLIMLDGMALHGTLDGMAGVIHIMAGEDGMPQTGIILIVDLLAHETIQMAMADFLAPVAHHQMLTDALMGETTISTHLVPAETIPHSVAATIFSKTTAISNSVHPTIAVLLAQVVEHLAEEQDLAQAVARSEVAALLAVVVVAADLEAADKQK